MRHSGPFEALHCLLLLLGERQKMLCATHKVLREVLGYLSRLISLSTPSCLHYSGSGLLDLFLLIRSLIHQNFIKGILSARHFYSLQRKSSY